jgi:hypothetical protein
MPLDWRLRGTETYGSYRIDAGFDDRGLLRLMMAVAGWQFGRLLRLRLRPAAWHRGAGRYTLRIENDQ